MERDANYTAVGAFVILVIAMAGLFVYWYSDSRDRRDYTRYEIYFEGSVTGLAVGSQVRYLGVDVGRVARISIDPRAADRVQVIVDIDAKAPVSQRTLAQLSLQGVTGLLYVDLLQGRPGANLVPHVLSEKYPVINAVRSDFDVLLATLPDVAGRSRELLSRLQDLLSPENTAAVTTTLANVKAASADLPETSRNLRALVVELRSTTTDTHALVRNVQGMASTLGPDFDRAVARLRETADNIAAVSGKLDRMAAENGDDLRAFAHDSLPEFDRTLREARGATDDLRTLLRQLSEDPSRVLYQPRKRGVEIPR
jgi:phospholipid/cholesterol/gamma-HCH transport system substrate-binding protein